MEYDENKDKIAFVGISNWDLDASKTNRGIFLSVPEPDEDDLKETALEIARAFDINVNKYKEVISALAEVYFKYKDSIKKDKDAEFHGARDFYNLIKNFAKKIIDKEI